MRKKPLSVRTLEQRRQRLLDRVDELVTQPDLFRPPHEILQLVASTGRDLDATTRELAERKGRAA